MEKESKSSISEGLTLSSSSSYLEKPSPMKGHSDKEGILSALKLSVVSQGTPHSSNNQSSHQSLQSQQNGNIITQIKESSPGRSSGGKKSVDLTETEMFSLLEKDEGNASKTEMNSNEEDKKVLIIYAGGFLGAQCGDQNNTTTMVLPRNLLQQTLKKFSYFCDLEFTQQHATEGFLVTPLSEFGRRIYYRVMEMSNLHANSTSFDRKCLHELLVTVKQNYDQFDSFVVVHGTDSLAYTASFLSFLITNLSKPIIFTGSMVPLSIMRNDAFSNLLGALTIAGHFHVPEVSIFFHHKLLRANRSTKIDAQGLDCFMSPNLPALAEFKVHVEVNWQLVLRNDPIEIPEFQDDITNANIEIVKFSPCFTETSLLHLIRSPGVKGIIIEGYGPGNLPVSDDFLVDAFIEAAEKEIIIVAISQSLKSYTSESNSNAYESLGIAYGGDMTTEATLAKLTFLLSKKYSRIDVIAMMSQNLRGELTLQQNDQKFEIKQENLVEAITEKFSARGNYRQSQVDLIKSYIVPNVACYMAQYGFMHYLQEMKVQQTNFQFCDYDKRTALHLAVREQKEQVVQFLISEKVDVNIVDYFGRSPLLEAILQKNKSIALMLVTAGAQVLGDKEEITTLLLESGSKGDIDTLKMLYHSGLKNLNEFTNIDERNIGHIAAADGQAEIIKYLKYTARLDFSQRDIWDRTPLDDAIHFKHHNIVKQLQTTFTI